MSSKDVYKKEFEKALAIEEKIKGFYKFYLDKLKDNHLLGKLKEIYADESRHVEIVKDIIAYFE